MNEWLKAFLSIAAIIAGVITIQYFLTETRFDFWYERAVTAVLGIGLLASGLTYFWTRSRLYKR